jgi:hypothetical protein
MARTCRLNRAGRSVEAWWQREGDALIVTPAGAPPLVLQLQEVCGLAGDGFTVRLRLPDGEVALERLGGDGPTLLEELWRDWPVLRAAALRLAAGSRPAEVWAGSFAAPGAAAVPFRGFLVGERLIVAPEGGDVCALFAADFASVAFDEAVYAVRASGWGGEQTLFGRLGARSAAFAGALSQARERLSRAAAAVCARHLPALAQGARAALAALWLPGRLLSLEALERVAPGFGASFGASWLASVPRAESGRALMAGLPGSSCLLGYAASSGEAPPELWLLVLRGESASLELLSHGDYATYLFHNDRELPDLVQGLVRLPDFSREALYLPLEQLTGERGVYAIPARDLPLLKQLRARFTGRSVHAAGSGAGGQA